MHLPEINSCTPPLLSEVIHDHQLGLCYEIEVPYGISREEAVANFRKLHLESQRKLSSNFASKIFSAGPTEVHPEIKVEKLIIRVERSIAQINEKKESIEDTILRGLFNFVTLGIFTAFGCASIQLPEADEFSKKLQREIRIDLNGNQALGSILFIHDLHRGVSLEENDFEWPKTIDPRKLHILIGLYQAKVYELLEHLRPKHIFMEGLAEDLPPSSYDQKVKFMREMIEKLEQQGVDLSNKENALIILALFGAGLVYSLKHKDVFLHKTKTKAEEEQKDKILKEYIQKYKTFERAMKEPFFKNFVENVRENWVTQKVIDFLRRNPGEKVVLIYGGAHNFCDDFIRLQFTPYLASIRWSNPLLSPNRLPKSCR
jgi:hypothetical protein